MFGSAIESAVFFLNTSRGREGFDPHAYHDGIGDKGGVQVGAFSDRK